MTHCLTSHRAHDFTALMAAWHRVARAARLHVVTLGEAEGLPVIGFETKAAAQGEPAAYISTGVHGDEAAAPWGLLTWAEQNIESLAPWSSDRRERLDILEVDADPPSIFPKGPKRYFSVPAVYSLENVRYPQADGSVCGLRPSLGADAALNLDCGSGLGAATHITGAFAFAAAGKALEMLLKRR